MEKFKIGDYHVDVKRNQLVIFGRTILLEPKVMDVLHYLASHPGEVISQQELFKALWPNSLFSSGSVLRSIAQLRKALGDDAKKQAMIITHPKRGYSLKLETEKLIDFPINEVKESELESLTECKEIPSREKGLGSLFFKRRFYLIIVLMFFIFLSVISIKSYFNADIKTQFSELIPITSTQHFESQPKFSPLVESVAFIRSKGGYYAHLWIKDLTTQKEFQLSKNSRKFLSLTWSSDGQAVAYISKIDNGFEIGYFDIPKSISKPLTAQVLSRFQSDKHVGSIQWSKDNQLYYLSFSNADLVSTPSAIYSLDVMTKTSRLIWQQNNEFKPYEMSLSPDNNSLALSGYGQNFLTDIQLLSIQDKSLVPLITNLPSYTELSWHPSGEYLLLTDLRELKFLSLSGESNVIEWLNFRNIETPSFNREGDKITLALSMTDVDIVHQLPNENNALKTIGNSNTIDSSARISPDGTEIVYLSENTGYQQVFHYQSGETQLLFDNKRKEIIDSPPLWFNDGKQVLINLDTELLLLDLKSKETRTLTKPANLSYIYAFFQNENALLIDYRTSKGITVAKYSLDDNLLTPITSGNINYAHLIRGDELVIIKNNSIVKVMNTIETVLFKASEDQQIVASVSINKGVLFQLHYLHEDGTTIKELWQINIEEKTPMFITKLPNILDKIIDASADGSQRLFNTPVQYEKDIVVLE